MRNLPPSVSTDDIEQEFKNFGRIKPGGVFIRNRMVNFHLCSLKCVLLHFICMLILTNKLLLYRRVEFAMHLLSLKIFLVFKMQSRFE